MCKIITIFIIAVSILSCSQVERDEINYKHAADNYSHFENIGDCVGLNLRPDSTYRMYYLPKCWEPIYLIGSWKIKNDFIILEKGFNLTDYSTNYLVLTGTFDCSSDTLVIQLNKSITDRFPNAKFSIGYDEELLPLTNNSFVLNKLDYIKSDDWEGYLSPSCDSLKYENIPMILSMRYQFYYGSFTSIFAYSKLEIALKDTILPKRSSEILGKLYLNGDTLFSLGNIKYIDTTLKLLKGKVW